MDFSGKVVLVTGASAGIGAATARLFAAHGARLALVGRNESNLRAVAAACAQPHAPLALVADLATDEGCERVAKQVLEHFGRLEDGNHSCVCAAEPPAPLALVAELATDVGCETSAGTLRKAALDHFTRLIALELAPKGVRVNTVSPGVTVSDFVKRLTDYTDEEYQNWLQAVERSVPMNRVCSPEDIAKTIIFLASEDAQLVTGTTVQVDGGLNLGSTSTNLISQQMK